MPPSIPVCKFAVPLVPVDKGCVTVVVADWPKVTVEVDSPSIVVVVESVSFDAPAWMAEVRVEVAVEVAAVTDEVELGVIVPEMV
jgi:hypothetical protein